MRYLLASLGILVATASSARLLTRKNCPWCEYLGGGMGGGGGRNCGFISLSSAWRALAATAAIAG